MDNHLQNRRYFAADRYAIADIALYAQTHLAHTCDFDLTAFPAVRAWLNRVAEQPGHMRMDEQPAEAAQVRLHNVGPGWAESSPPSIPEFLSTENAIDRRFSFGCFVNISTLEHAVSLRGSSTEGSTKEVEGHVNRLIAHEHYVVFRDERT
jgi:hypothetical protein